MHFVAYTKWQNSFKLRRVEAVKWEGSDTVMASSILKLWWTQCKVPLIHFRREASALRFCCSAGHWVASSPACFTHSTLPFTRPVDPQHSTPSLMSGLVLPAPAAALLLLLPLTYGWWWLPGAPPRERAHNSRRERDNRKQTPPLHRCGG